MLVLELDGDQLITVFLIAVKDWMGSIEVPA